MIFYLNALEKIYKDEVYLKAAKLIPITDQGACYAIGLLTSHYLYFDASMLFIKYFKPIKTHSLLYWWPVKGYKVYSPEHDEHRMNCLCLMHHILGDLIKEMKRNNLKTITLE